MRDLNREAVQRRLEALDFAVEVVPEDERARQPDLVATKGGTRMFVEVKTRVEDATLRVKMESVPVGATEPVLTVLDKHNALSSDIKHGNSQLRSAATPEDFRLLWFRADSGPFVYDAREQIGATLLGIRMVVVETSAGRQPRACVYAGHADFFRFQDIDGVMIEVDGAITLLLNQFSPRSDAFAASPISTVISSSVLDVARAEEAGSCYVVDGDAHRKGDAALLEHLRLKYPTDQFVEFVTHYAGTVVTTIDVRSRGGV